MHSVFGSIMDTCWCFIGHLLGALRRTKFLDNVKETQSECKEEVSKSSSPLSLARVEAHVERFLMDPRVVQTRRGWQTGLQKDAKARRKYEMATTGKRIHEAEHRSRCFNDDAWAEKPSVPPNKRHRLHWTQRIWSGRTRTPYKAPARVHNRAYPRTVPDVICLS